MMFSLINTRKRTRDPVWSKETDVMLRPQPSWKFLVAPLLPKTLATPALGRGEMQHGSTGDSDGEIDVQFDIEENSDSEQDNDIDEHLIETPESMEDEEEEKEYDIEENRSNPDASQHVMTSNDHMISGSKTMQLAPGIGGLTFAKSLASSQNLITEHEYPKPAYSYSCLISLALKNSRSGSLPVSEIYSFICKHFPYFKTAPTSWWKNSVRHNLSLNKCFEKIEKPSTNGGQRKDSLWAMNPTKISKMDEEVQKWSRKYPMSIREAMVFPENLDALERGEMKHGSTGYSDDVIDLPSDIEENSDSGQDNDIDEHLIEIPEYVEDEEEEKEYDIEEDSSGPILDFYISDSMQDMLDIDIRTEVATVVGGTNELTSLVNDLPSLDIESNSNDGDISWLNAPRWSATNDIYADVGACVNPNSVMPIITSSILNSPKAHVNLNTNNYRTIHSPPPSPKECKSHLTFSPHQIKVPSIQEHKRPSQLATTNRNNPDTIKKDLLVEIKKEKEERASQHVMTSNGHIISGSNTIKLAPGIGGLTFANSIAYTKLKHTTVMKAAPNALSNNVIIKKDRDSSPLRSVNTNAISNGYNNHVNSQNVGKILARNILVHSKNVSVNGLHSSVNNSSQGTSNNSTHSSKTKVKITEHEYPKPAYSYSCLIAMALKNSRSGSLPVSEIYSFMCEHFPYFKTAPNGWKNSVRHNLSLNKCFEKIEKPTTNGGQRKGCLWAMNPTKISKMDEEVQKWSRKDPMAIRKAMVFPENLDALERGEMKHGSSGDSDGEIDVQSDIEENSDSEQDNDIDEHLIETPESMEDEEEDKEYDIEITDIYDGIDLEDNKEALRLAIQRNEILDLPDDDYPSPKRARLDVNYSIGPAGAFEHHQIQHQRQNQSTHHSRRKMPLVNRIV